MKSTEKIITFLLLISLGAKAQQTLKVGDTLAGLALKSTSGTIYDLKDQKNAKGFILVFMTPTCDHCILYEPRVAALNNKYKPKGFPVVAIGPYGDDEIKYPLDAMKEMKKLAESKKFTFPYVSDEKFKYTWLFNIRSTPMAVILQKRANGYLIKYIGKIDDEEDPKKVPKDKFVESVVNKLVNSK